MATSNPDSSDLLERALEADRVHSAYLLSGPPESTREAAEWFARALVCSADDGRPCNACAGCHRSKPSSEPVELDGTGKKGPLHRHIGDHPDLLWTERDPNSTRVRIAQVRALHSALRMGANEGGWRVAVVADAELLNVEAQNALLRLLEEPPNRTAILLAATNASSLLATIRSRCQRVQFSPPDPMPLRDDAQDPEVRDWVDRLDAIAELGVPALLDWAEEFRGARAAAAERVGHLLDTGSEWLRERTHDAVRGDRWVDRSGGEIDAFRTLGACRRDLVQRNANPQMIAERALLAVRRAVGA